LHGPGLSSNGRHPDRPAKSGSGRPEPRVRHEIETDAGELVAIHLRKGPWLKPDGTAYVGVRPKMLPLYGSQRLRRMPVLLSEGEKATDAANDGVGSKYVCLGTFGTSALPDTAVLQTIVDREVILAPDNDDKGRLHMDEIGDRLRTLGCKSVRVVTWEGVPEKGDAFEYLTDHFRTEMRELLEGAPTWPAAEPESPSGLEAERLPGPPDLATCWEIFKGWLEMPDPGHLYVALAAVVANRGRGDPVWLLLVGGPSTGKTEVIMALSGESEVHLAAELTQGGLLSGTQRRDRARDASGGLLRKIGRFGIILLKDFGSILSMNRDTRAQLIAALREVFDGSWTRNFGTDGPSRAALAPSQELSHQQRPRQRPRLPRAP
jgi:hypothetical protein